MNYSNHPATKEYRRLLRMTETPTERMLWKELKGKQLEGYRFRQQHGFGPYEERTIFLKENRIKVLRFRNEEVEQNINDVLERIKDYIRSINQGQEVVQTPNPLT